MFIIIFEAQTPRMDDYNEEFQALKKETFEEAKEFLKRIGYDKLANALHNSKSSFEKTQREGKDRYYAHIYQVKN